ncbi:MAG: exosortase system-associated protein, TIGR04073 family [Verrucomicrobiota bacterium]
MKTLLCFATLAFLSFSAFADIQDPVMNDYGPTRKLGRGMANVVWASTELIYSPTMVNVQEGNSSAWSFGIVKGLGRFFYRMGFGFYEMGTFPFATYKGSYNTPYKSNIPWIHGGLEEFPPELGFETRYRYTHSWN